MIGIVDAVYVMVYARIKMVPLSAPARWKNIWASTKEASWALGTIVVIFGGIYGGVFTPTEAAGVAVVYSLFVAMFVYRDGGHHRAVADHRQFGVADRADPDHRHRGRRLFLADDHERHPAKRDRTASSRCTCRIGRRCCSSMSDYLIAGSFLEPPRRDPDPHAAAAAGRRNGRHRRDPLRHHHGGEFSIGLYMPPFGLNLFASRAVFNVPMGAIYRGVLPFVVVNFIALLVITYVPAISMVLVGCAALSTRPTRLFPLLDVDRELW